MSSAERPPWDDGCAMSRYRLRAMTGAVCGATFLHMLDVSSTVVALPSIRDALGLSSAAVSVVVTTYYVALLLSLPLSDWLARRFSPRLVFASAAFGFAAGALVCAVSDDAAVMMTGRFAQGAAGGLFLAVGRAMLLAVNDRRDFLKITATLAIPALMAPLTGPPVVGMLVEHVSWRAIFFASAGIAFVVAALTLVSRPAAIAARKDTAVVAERFDAAGYGLIAGASLGILGALDAYGRGLLGPLPAAAVLAAGVVLAAIFWRHERRVDHPLLDLSLLSEDRGFLRAVLGGTLSRFSLGAVPLLLSLLLQDGYGLSPTVAGGFVLLPAAGAILVKLICGPTGRLLGFRSTILVSGAMASLLTALVYPVAVGSGPVLLVVVLVALGLSRSMMLTFVNALAYEDVPSTRMGQATTIATGAQQIAIMGGTVVAALVTHLGPASPDAGPAIVHAAGWGFMLIGSISAASVAVFRALPRYAGMRLMR